MVSAHPLDLAALQAEDPVVTDGCSGLQADGS
jgi:hypothetical protein